MDNKHKNDASCTIKVLTANLHVAAGVKPLTVEPLSEEVVLKNLAKAAKIFQNSKADVILLQEVDFNSARTAGINQGKWLAEKLGMHLTYAETFNTHGKDYPYPEVLKNCLYGIAVLSRQKPISTSKTWLFNPPEVESWPENERRVLLGVELVFGDKKVIIYNTHLDYRNRVTRKKELLQIAGEISGKTAVVGGDFNEPWPSFTAKTEEDQKLIELHGWQVSDNWPDKWFSIMGVDRGNEIKNSPTYPVGEKVAIDHIFTGSRADVKFIKTIDSEAVSDHFFVLAEIEFQ